MLTTDVSVMVDIQNVYYGSLNYGDGGSKIDYEKLQIFLEYEVDHSMSQYQAWFQGIYDWSAYVVQTPRYNGIGLFALLRRLGYNLRVQRYPSDLPPDANWRGEVASSMQMDYVQQCPNNAAMVVVSGNGAMAPVFEASARNWPKVRRILVTWEHTMHSAFEDRKDIIDDIIYLDDKVLRRI